MLKTISPLLTPDALHALASMGHGDELVIADANFPAAWATTSSHPRRSCSLRKCFPIQASSPPSPWRASPSTNVG